MLNKLLFYCIVKPISWLPFWMLYVVSDVMKFFVYHVFGYRKKVVRKNIKSSFPDKSEKEIKQIESKFYSHFTDLVMESLKMFSVSKKQLAKRMVSLNSEVFDPFYEKGQDVICASGHYGNWEMWATYGAQHFPHNPRGVYKPLKNKFWDDTAKKSRGRYGMNLVSVKDAANQFGRLDEPCAVLLLIDQSPARTKKCYWTTFLGQDTAINFGMEALAKKNNAPVIYGDIQKVKRGYFEVTWTVVTENPEENEYGWITEKATSLIENKIKQNPHLWLWTHKRWKRERREDEPLMNILQQS